MSIHIKTFFPLLLQVISLHTCLSPLFFLLCLDFINCWGGENLCGLFWVYGVGTLCEKYTYCIVRAVQFTGSFLSQSLTLALYFMYIYSNHRYNAVFVNDIHCSKIVSSSALWKSMQAELRMPWEGMELKCHPRKRNATKGISRYARNQVAAP